MKTLDRDSDDNQHRPHSPALLAAPLIESDPQPLVGTRHVRHACSARDVRLALPNLLVLPVNSGLVWTRGPVAHRAAQGWRAVWLVDNCGRGSTVHDIICEAAGAGVAGLGGCDGGGPVVALLETDVAVCTVVVGGGELELDPRGGQLGSSLDAALEGTV